MWVSGKRMRELENRLTELENKTSYFTSQYEPYRVGLIPCRASLRDVVGAILVYLNLEVFKTEAQESKIILQEKETIKVEKPNKKGDK